MENTSSNLDYLELSENDNSFIFNFYKKHKMTQLKKQKLEDLEENYKMTIILILAFLEKKIDSNLTVNKIIDVMLPVTKKSNHIKRVLEKIRELCSQLKCENSDFLALHTNFGFYSLFFITLNKIIDRFNELDIKKIWTLFLFLCEAFQKKQNLEISDKIEILSTVVIKELCGIYSKDKYDEFVSELKKFFGYSIEKKEFEQYSEIIQKTIPEFNPLLFDKESIEKYATMYINCLKSNELNFLVFLEKEKNINSITLTPLLKNTSKCVSEKPMKNHYNTNLNNVSLVSQFKQVVSVIRSPEKQLHSPNLKKELLIEDKLEEFSKIYQWYKEMTQDIILKQMIIKGISYQVSEECSNYLEIGSIRNSYVKVLKIIDRINLEDKERVLKMFFKLFSEFMKIEFTNIFEFERVKDLFKTSVFLKSLFALSLEIDTLIRNLAIFNFSQIIDICEISYYDFWKILFNFAKDFGKSLPKIMKRRIVELEYLTLLKYIWIPRKNQNEEDMIDLKIKENYSNSENNSEIDNNSQKPSKMLNKAEELSFNNKSETQKYIIEAEKILDGSDEYIVKRLLNILAERIYLITDELEISDELKETMWFILKSFIFENRLSEIDMSIENFHLDWIILLSIYHVIYFNKIYVKLNELIEIYEKRALCSIYLIKEDLQKFYNETFKTKIKDIKMNTPNVLTKDWRENANSTPIHNKNIKIKKLTRSPLIENLKINSAKKDIKDFAKGIFGGNSRKSSVDIDKDCLDISMTLNNEKTTSEFFNISRSHSFHEKSVLNQKIVSPLSVLNLENEDIFKERHKFEIRKFSEESKDQQNEEDNNDGAHTPCFN
jgi:hypothetical protein